MTRCSRPGWFYGRSKCGQIPDFTKARVGLGFDRKVRLYTTREAAIILRHTVRWVRDQIKSGKMSAVKFGSEYFIHSFEINRWMGNNPRGSQPFLVGKGKRHAKTKKAPKKD